MREGRALPGGRPMGREMACLALRDRGKHRVGYFFRFARNKGRGGEPGDGMDERERAENPHSC